MNSNAHYSAVVIGASAGGLNAVSTLLSKIPENYALPIIIVQHRAKEEKELLEEILSQKCKIKVKQADEKEKIIGGIVYVAPPDYHLMVEHDRTFSLSKDPAVKHSRPSIDVLFETASNVYKDELVAVILTGASDDGADGIKLVHHHHGLTIAQNPGEAVHPAMPVSSIRTGSIKRILSLNEIQGFLLQLSKKQRHEASQ